MLLEFISELISAFSPSILKILMLLMVAFSPVSIVSRKRRCYLFISKLNAPLGHCFTWATIFSVEAASIFIHGASLGLKTSLNPRTQIPECMHLADSQITVTSPFEYFLVRLCILSYFNVCSSLRSCLSKTNVPNGTNAAINAIITRFKDHLNTTHTLMSAII